MTGNFDFWNFKKSEKMSGRKKSSGSFFQIASIYFRSVKSFFFASWLIIKSFFVSVFRLPRLLNKFDKFILLVLSTTLIVLLGFYFKLNYFDKTKIVASDGGTFQEILIGEAQYLNPVLAKTDVDKTINRLIYSGLTKVDKSGQVIADLAENWEVSADSKSYTFHLKENLFWHDGVPFLSTDVAYTIESIKDQNLKSSYYSSWKDIEVETPDEKTVIFKLSNPYGPFVYNTTVGIIPTHVDFQALSSMPIGTGPYKFSNAKSGKNQKIYQVMLEKNPSYFAEKYYIEKILFQIDPDEKQAKKGFSSGSSNAVAGIKVDDNESKSYSYPTSRQFAIIFNTRNEKFKDAVNRKKIKSGEKFEPPLEFSLLVLDKTLSVSVAESLISEYREKGIKINLQKQSAVNYQTLLEKRDFQAVLYGFDFGYDRDPYPFWHSSQIASGENYAGFADKNADILLEDARMSADFTLRNQKYDQFMTILNDQVPVIFLSAETFSVSVKEGVNGISEIKGFEPWDHLNQLSEWYVKTKRVKP
ncbi:MAG: peptide/nickel transport system substrate-binding protein [Candidatus Berkelbacteria bacterium Athens1014_28]|uniref:Peptide/nickel transport system substrate-binding protein n=1 Tax=Candidatus Berkelbacteria bacterium Athens1014_28 TaxID=2017145 RepID=A0A554LPP2_9BACT|nr:MAG: peptide/nickel transport system substrate-binding protein [Candidatus Berkelbacteria bacterium Athens1014_28]